MWVWISRDINNLPFVVESMYRRKAALYCINGEGVAKRRTPVLTLPGSAQNFDISSHPYRGKVRKCHALRRGGGIRGYLAKRYCEVLVLWRRWFLLGSQALLKAPHSSSFSSHQTFVKRIASLSLLFLRTLKIVLDEASKLFDKSRSSDTAFVVGMVGGDGTQEPKTHDHDIGISLFFIQQLMQMLQQIVCCANSSLRAFCCFELERWDSRRLRVNLEN